MLMKFVLQIGLITYFATAIDLYSRKILLWGLSDTMNGSVLSWW